MEKSELRAKITGAFITFHRKEAVLDLSPEQWVQELTDMRQAGIDAVIVGSTMSHGRTLFLSEAFEACDERERLAPMMEAASAAGMAIYLGLFMTSCFWGRGDEDFARLMRRDLAICRVLVDELARKYGGHPSLAGFYMSHEPDRLNLATEVRAEALKSLSTGILERVRATGLPLLVSPFFDKQIPPQELARWWDAFLDRPLFDIVAMQDGIGCDRGITPDDVEPRYRLLAEVFRAHGLRFWNNVETFAMNSQYIRTRDRSKLAFTPAPLDRVERQWQAGRAYVEKSITWEWSNYLSRQLISADWYESFRRWNLL